MAQEFQGYTFDDANALLTTLSSDVGDMNFYNDNDSKSSSFSPESQTSSFNTADYPWSHKVPLENNGAPVKKEFDMSNLQGFGDLNFDTGENFVNFGTDPGMGKNIDRDGIGNSISETNNFESKNANIFLATPESLSIVSPNHNQNSGDSQIPRDSSLSVTELDTGANSSLSIHNLDENSASPLSDNVLSSPEFDEMKPTDISNNQNGGKKVSKTQSKVTKPKKGRASHKMVEKKYRTNINTKILALRDAVPSLKVATLGVEGGSSVDLDGLTPASKLNKASVLTKATEYIQHLERKNKKLQKENEELKNIFSQLGSRNANNNNSNNNSSNNNNNNNYPLNFFQNPQQQPIPNFPPQYNPQFFNQMPPQPQHPSHGPPQPQPPSPSHPQPPNDYSMSMPMRLAVGTMAAMAGSNMLSGEGNDFRGLSAVPFAHAKIFTQFLNLAKLSLIIYATYIVFEPLLKFKGAKGQKVKEGLESSLTATNGSISLAANLNSSVLGWFGLGLDVAEIRCFKIRKPITDGARFENIINVINDDFFRSDKNKSNKDLLFTYLQLLKYNCQSNVRLGLLQLFIGNMLKNSSKIFGLVTLLGDEKSILAGLRKVKDVSSSADFKPLIDDIDNILGSKDLIQRLTNSYFCANRSINYNVKVGKNQSSFSEILDDIIVNSDIISYARNIRGNELLRATVVNFLKTMMYKDDDTTENESNKDLLKQLTFIEQLTLPESIMNLRVKLVISLLDQSKTNETMKIVKKTISDISNSAELNGDVASELNESVTDDSEIESTSDKDLDIAVTNDDKEELGELEDNSSENADGTDVEASNFEDEIDNILDEETKEGAEVGSDETEGTVASGDAETINSKTPEKDVSLKILSKGNAKLSISRLINGEVFISLTSSLILRYLNAKQYKEADGLLKHLLNYKNTYLFNTEKQVTLLSFVSILAALFKFDKVLNNNHGYELDSKHSLMVENLIASLRYWIGTESQITRNINDLDRELKAEICDELVSLGVRFSGIDVEK